LIANRDRSRFAKLAPDRVARMDDRPDRIACPSPMDAASFVSALLAIVLIDLVLAGDNAIVIALAARGLPPELRKRAIVWGAVGAVAVRSLMTAVVVWLLHIPGLLVAGGLLLLWIAYRLLMPEAHAEDRHAPVPATFWGAMRTIVVADAVMGLDNVLAVAGAAHGSYLLVVAGLVISVPIVVWGSTVVLKIVDRFPGVVYLGAGVLVWTAVKMVSSEPLLRPWLEQAPALGALAYLAIPLVLGLAFVANHRHLQSRIHARLAAQVALPAHAGAPAREGERRFTQGETPVSSILVPVDGSRNALQAVRHVIAEHRRDRELQLHLLNVQPRVSRHAARFVSRSNRQGWLNHRAQAAMASAVTLLNDAGVPHRTHCAIGRRADEICRSARELEVDRIVMGTARKNSLTRMLQDSVTHRVLETTTVPVEVVAGDAVSRWERWGLPAGVLGLGGLLILAAD
jgi:YjbE family integral membrane protein